MKELYEAPSIELLEVQTNAFCNEINSSFVEGTVGGMEEDRPESNWGD